MPQEITGMSGATHIIRYEYDRDNRLVKHKRIRKAVSYFNSYEFQDIFLKMKSIEVYESMRMRLKML